ncbi:MAG: substrate-binding domain-containing protein [Apibacter sp.]|nr:substrate-binding domain-containing protein [Apibacter sp.]
MNNRLSISPILFLAFLFICISCQEDIIKKKAYRQGTITLAIDPSLINLGTALVDVFQSSYPESKILFKSEVEDLVIADLLNGKVPIAMTTRDLTLEEAKILYNHSNVNYISTQIACDATVFVVSKESSINEIDLTSLKSKIISDESKFVFDGGNSSNFNNLKKKIGFKLVKNQKIKSFSNGKEVINFVSKNISYIGIIGLDVLSEADNKEVKQFLSKVKVLPIKKKDAELIYPTIPNLREGIYPFTRRVFLLNAEDSFKVGSSFSRFCGSQRGQLIVKRAGLQPYYLYERRIELH